MFDNLTDWHIGIAKIILCHGKSAGGEVFKDREAGSFFERVGEGRGTDMKLLCKVSERVGLFAVSLKTSLNPKNQIHVFFRIPEVVLFDSVHLDDKLFHQKSQHFRF